MYHQPFPAIPTVDKTHVSLTFSNNGNSESVDNTHVSSTYSKKATEGIIRVTNLVQQWQQCNKLVCHLPSQTMATMDKTRVTIITNLFHGILKWQP